MRYSNIPPDESDCPKCFGVLYILQSDSDKETIFCVKCSCNSNDLTLYGYSEEHTQILLRSCGKIAWVDAGIANDIKLLWENDIWTWVSCEGGQHCDKYIGLINSDDSKKALELIEWANSFDSQGGWIYKED